MEVFVLFLWSLGVIGSLRGLERKEEDIFSY